MDGCHCGKGQGFKFAQDGLAPAGEAFVAGKGNFETLVKRYKRQLVLEALQTTGNNKIQTAQLLGISKSYLFKLIKQLSVRA